MIERITPWHDVSESEAWVDSKVQAYRIHIQEDGRYNYFRHEFKLKSGLTIFTDWIKYSS